MQQLPLGVRLVAHASFATFVAGPNAAALEAVRALAQPTGRGVLWLFGPQGSGRTHLLHAFCAACDPQQRIGYLEGAAARAAGPDGLRAWNGLDALCIDGVGQLMGELQLERALFTLYRDLDERQGRLLVTADAPPQQLSWQLADIGSRFAAAAVQRLQLLDDAQRREALQRHAGSRGLELPEETARYLLRRASRDLPSLIALLDRLDMAALAAQRRLTVPFVSSVLGPESLGTA